MIVRKVLDRFIVRSRARHQVKRDSDTVPITDANSRSTWISNNVRFDTGPMRYMPLG